MPTRPLLDGSKALFMFRALHAQAQATRRTLLDLSLVAFEGDHDEELALALRALAAHDLTERILEALAAGDHERAESELLKAKRESR